MKILMVAPEPFFEARGTPFSEYYRIRSLLEQGHTVDLYTYPLGEEVSLPGLTVHRSLKPFWIKSVVIGPSINKLFLDFFLFLKALFAAWRGRGSYGYVHTHEEAGYLGALVKRVFKIPHLYDMHSSLPQQMINFNTTKSPFVIGLLKRGEGFVLRSADRIITICPELYKYVTSLFPEKRVFLIENFLDQEYEVDPERVKEIRALFPGKRIVLYAGTLEYYQGIEILLEATRFLPEDVALLSVGGRDDQIRDLLRKGEYDPSRVRLLPQVPKREISSYIAGCDVLVSPRKEGTNTPLKIYSYMKSGKPVVATSILSHTQILDETTSILVEPTPQGLARGILEAFGERGVACAVKAEEYGKEHFSPERYLHLVALSVEGLGRS